MMSTLTDAQKKVAKDTHRFRVVNAGRRSGKTHLAVEEIIGKAVAERGRTITYIAPTFRQARDIAWEKMKERYEPLLDDVNESRLQIRVKTQDGGTSMIKLESWEKVESLRGQSFDFVVMDEVAMYTDFWMYWHEVVRPTLTDTQADALFISTPKGFNHFYDLYNLEAEDDNFSSFHFTTYDNPHIPKEEVNEAREELTQNRFAQEYMADFRKQEGLVYKEFQRDRHIYDNDTRHPQWIDTLAGVDFGFNNPAAVLEIKKDQDGGYWVENEWYKQRKTNEQIIEYAQSFNPEYVYPDPSEPDRIKEMDDKGLYTMEVNNDVSAGINRVRELFNQGRIHIHKRCRNLISELETYHYPDDARKGKIDRSEYEKPVKENDHAVDALRYALFMNSENETLEMRQDDFSLYSTRYD